jgi:Ribonuclease HI
MSCFQVIQYNAHNAYPVMASFLTDKKTQKADVIAIQEPWVSPQSTTTHYPNKATHQLVFPKTSECEGERARVCLFVSKRIDPGTWSCKTVSKAYQLLKLRRNHREGWTDLFVHNIYNNDDEIVEKLGEELARRPYTEHILVGDMNLHHPVWGGEGVKTSTAAERLLDTLGKYDMGMTTERGTATWRRNKQASVIDLTFVSNSLIERVIECRLGTDHGSDHYPVVTTIDIVTPPYEPIKRRNWKATDDRKLAGFVEQHINQLTDTNTNLITADDVENECQALIKIITDAVDISTPWAIPSQWANPSFTPECQEAVKEVRRLRRRHERTGDPYDKELYNVARNRKTRLIKTALRLYHRRKVQEVIEEGPTGMWKMNKWARNRQGAYDKGITPSIKIPESDGLAETVKEKAAAFQQAFFPIPPPADLSDIDRIKVNHQPIYFPEITHQEIIRAVKASPPNKAPGEDGLPNLLWHKLIEIPPILDTILRIYNACVRIGTNPSHFQKSITVVLRKAGKRDYQLAKSYRPVALLNTLGKFLEAVIARRISYAVETEGLLPNTHLGGRKGISVDHAIQLIIGRVRRAWGSGNGKIASMLMLDVSGAYDNVSHERLIYNLYKRRLGQLAPWIRAFLTERSTRIRMPEGISDQILTPTGIPQGSPLSPILYLIYNADLVEGCRDEGVRTNAWVDDVAFIVTGESEQENISKLKIACQHADAWAARHASVFDPKKYALIHFVNPEVGGEKLTPLILPSTTVQATTTAERYLGIWLDPGLTFQHHREQMLVKAGISLQALRGLTGSTWGASLSTMRAIYQAVMIPQMLFGAAAWHSPLTTTRRERGYMRKFAGIQSRAACLMSGAFKTTAREALDIELHLLPMQQQLDRLVQLTAIRIRTGPRYAVPKTMLQERNHTQRQKGGWTPMEAQSWKKDGCLRTPGTVEGDWESRKAYIQAPWSEPPRVYIEDRETARTAHDRIWLQLEEPLRFYTDGSGYQGGIGAAVYQGTESRLCHMGTDNMATVYAAELRAIEMALEIIKERFLDDQQRHRLVYGAVIFTDNQAALRAIQNPKMPSGQIYLEGCLRILEWCAGKIQIEIRWVPAHEGILGNETADMLAKEAATAKVNHDQDHNHNSYIRLAAAAKRGIKQDIKAVWEKSWSKTGRTARRTRRLIEAPNKSNLAYWKGLRKASSSVLIQLRTGIIGLAEYLAKIKKVDSPRCQCNMGNQSVRHVLLECPLLEEQRHEMMNELFEEGVSMTLGEEEMLREAKAAPIVAKFMIATGLLGQFQSVDSVAMGKEKGAGDEDLNPTKPIQETASAGETGRTTQWPGTRSAEATSHQRTWRSAIADDEDDEAWRRDPNLFVYDLPA